MIFFVHKTMPDITFINYHNMHLMPSLGSFKTIPNMRHRVFTAIIIRCHVRHRFFTPFLALKACVTYSDYYIAWVGISNAKYTIYVMNK